VTGRLRVLYLSGWSIGPKGEGAVSFVHEQIVELSRYVDALFVEHEFSSLRSLARHPRRSLDPQLVANTWPPSVRALRVHTLRLPTRITHRSLIGDIRSAGDSVARRLRRAGERVDLVHAHVVLPAGLLGAQLAAELRVPLVLQEHSGPLDMHLDTEEKAAAVRETLSRAAVVLAVSHALAGRLRSVLPELQRLDVVPNLVRTEVFLPTPPPPLSDPLRLVSIGGLVPVKNHAMLLECVAELTRRGSSATLMLVGDGPLRSDLEAWARQLGISDQVSFTGHLGRAATARALASSHLYVCCSRIETFGLAVAEAVATGRPVVTTACGGPEEIVEPGLGLIVRSHDPVSIANAVLEVQARLDTFEPKAMHANIERRFGPESFRTRMLASYERALMAAL
jgi:glycosyltransferase involved in cell wall biosynthesis